MCVLFVNFFYCSYSIAQSFSTIYVRLNATEERVRDSFTLIVHGIVFFIFTAYWSHCTTSTTSESCVQCININDFFFAFCVGNYDTSLSRHTVVCQEAGALYRE